MGTVNPRPTTDLIVVHCSATSPDYDIGAKEIDRWHRKRGWRKIGYHYVIRRDGTVEPGRELLEIGAHAKGYNHQSISVCLVGGVDAEGNAEKNYTDEQDASLYAVLTSLSFTFPEADILGHRDLSPDLNGDGSITPDEFTKECPCFDVREAMANVGFRTGMDSVKNIRQLL